MISQRGYVCYAPSLSLTRMACRFACKQLARRRRHRSRFYANNDPCSKRAAANAFSKWVGSTMMSVEWSRRRLALMMAPTRPELVGGFLSDRPKGGRGGKQKPAATEFANNAFVARLHVMISINPCTATSCSSTLLLRASSDLYRVVACCLS